MVNDISIKKELKKEQTTTEGAGSACAVGPKSLAAVSTLELLRNVGFDEATARRLAQERSKESIERQVEWLPQRAATRNKLGFLRRAIEQDWPKPEGAEAAEDSFVEAARLFASHYYAAYHDFRGQAATEPLPKDVNVAVKFVSRLLAQEGDQNKIPEWGRRFGRFMRQRHQGDAKAKPNLSYALVLYGDNFLRILHSEATTRQTQVLGRAKESHQKEFMAEYISYLRQAEGQLRQNEPSVYGTFVEHRTRLRHLMTNGPFLSSAESLARFDCDQSRLLDFAEFFQARSDQFVLNFWQWDTRLNPRSFGTNSKPANLQEANP